MCNFYFFKNPEIPIKWVFQSIKDSSFPFIYIFFLFVFLILSLKDAVEPQINPNIQANMKCQ